MEKQAQYIQVIRAIYPEIRMETVQFKRQGQVNALLLVNQE
jgi:hypothetical protein